MAIKVIDYTPQVKAKIKENIENTLKAVGYYVMAEAMKNIKKNKSVDMGFLLNGVEFDIDEEKGIVRIGNTMEYAIYIEKGTGIYAVDGDGRKTPWVFQDIKGEWHRTVGQEPKPFLKPAIEDNMDTIVKIIIANMKEGLEE